MAKPKVFLTGGDEIGWALDDDLALTRRSLESIVEFTDLASCEVIHSVWWEGLLAIPAEVLAGKRIICHVSNRPFYYLQQPRFCLIRSMVGVWITVSGEAQRELSSINVSSQLIPYTIDTNTFAPVAADDPELLEVKRRWNIPADRYLIGNFHRDTEGRDLCSPKLQKGPDILAETVNLLAVRCLKPHVLLAGPRRFWIRSRLQELGIPYTFVGTAIEGSDDIGVNILPRRTLNLLYNLIDLYAITSRWEGGPRSVMEAAAARCKVISTRVGLAEDILEPASIYDSPLEAARIVEKDMRTGHLEASLEPQFRRTVQEHHPAAAAASLRRLYAELDAVPVCAASGKSSHPVRRPNPLRRATAILRKLYHRPPEDNRFSVGIWRKFVQPPYGGGNQFMLALRKSLERRGVNVAENSTAKNMNAYLMDSIWFDTDGFQKHWKKHSAGAVHRIDGPICLTRGSDRTSDDLCFELNARYASATVVQSVWNYQRIIELGYAPVRPVIIHNTVDPYIFNSCGRISFDHDRKIRLISTSWSNNPRKGGDIYKWLDQHLDWSRFDYTFVGNVSEKLVNIRHLQPMPSEALADILRRHDIYITASRNDPCSNAVIEALACGLPVLYLNDGGHPELVGQGGLPFIHKEEILPQLELLIEHYEMFQRLITVQDIEAVADKYLNLLREVA